MARANKANGLIKLKSRITVHRGPLFACAKLSRVLVDYANGTIRLKKANFPETSMYHKLEL